MVVGSAGVVVVVECRIVVVILVVEYGIVVAILVVASWIVSIQTTIQLKRKGTSWYQDDDAIALHKQVSYLNLFASRVSEHVCTLSLCMSCSIGLWVEIAKLKIAKAEKIVG